MLCEANMTKFAISPLSRGRAEKNEHEKGNNIKMVGEIWVL